MISVLTQKAQFLVSNNDTKLRNSVNYSRNFAVPAKKGLVLLLHQPTPQTKKWSNSGLLEILNLDVLQSMNLTCFFFHFQSSLPFLNFPGECIYIYQSDECNTHCQDILEIR